MVTCQPPYYNIGFTKYGDFSAPEIRRLQDARAAALASVDEARRRRAAHFATHGHSGIGFYDTIVAEAEGRVPAEPNVDRRIPGIEDFGMNVANFERIHNSLKDLIGFAEDAVARRRLAVLAYGLRAGGRRRKTQRRRARRVKRRTLRR